MREEKRSTRLRKIGVDVARGGIVIQIPCAASANGQHSRGEERGGEERR